ncbi:hypothetical protein ACT4S5_13095 [Kocuria oceani]|uniref:hypothetical protein n=1 Tax=Kocuria oceani TaxID=988827 RepID=UPI004035F951
MDQSAQHTDAVPVPTAGQVLVRTMPVAAVLIIGMPLAIQLMLDESGETRTFWWLLPLLAVFGLAMLIHHYAKAPRPRYDKRVGQAQWKQAFAAAATTGALPEHADVRKAVGVTACLSIEALVGAVAIVIAFLLCAPFTPAFPWLAALGAPVILTVVYAFRARRGWAYLSTLHAAGRTG